MGDVLDLYKRLKGHLANDASDQDAAVQDAFFDGTWNFFKASADAMAADASTIGALKVPFNVQIIALDVVPNTTLTAHDTNNAVITLGKADGAGGSSTAVATLTTNTTSGNWAADTFKAATLSATFANTLVSDGQVLTLKITKGASGVVVPISSYTIRYRRV